MRMTQEAYDAMMAKRRGFQKGSIIGKAPSIAELQRGTKLARAGHPVTNVIAAPKPVSEIEEMLARQIEEAKLPVPVREYPFLRGSRHRLDFAWPEHWINGFQFGCEVQGMVHRVKARFSADLEKRAQALLQNWVILEVGGEQIRNGKAIEWLKLIFAKQVDGELRALGVPLP